MACSFPLTGFQLEDGSVVFCERTHHASVRTLTLPCGRCARCRLERSRQWAVRCIHESKLYDENSFVTLTYDDAHLPIDRSLQYVDFQKFMKRLRKYFAPRVIRFYMCGEYGDETLRPHYHAILFNCGFRDKLYFKRAGECVLYTSRCLEGLWPLGNSLIGAVTFESAAYVARYCMATVSGRDADLHYRVVDVDSGEVRARKPEFGRMSLRPGIGGPWLERFMWDVFPRGEVVVNEKLAKSPRYYDKLFAKHDPDGFAQLQFQRYCESAEKFEDNSDARLAVKEQVAIAGLAQKVRSL